MKARPEELHELQPVLARVWQAAQEEHDAWQAEAAQAMAEFERKALTAGDASGAAA